MSFKHRFVQYRVKILIQNPQKMESDKSAYHVSMVIKWVHYPVSRRGMFNKFVRIITYEIHIST